MEDIKFLDELIDYLYGHKPYDYRADKIREMLDAANPGKGRIWEHVVAKGMQGRASLLEANSVGRDMDDNTDMKLAVFTTWNSHDGRSYATISIENKIGPLRVCLIKPGRDKHKVYFMFVPTHAHQNRDNSHPVKITWGKTGPIGDWWDRYRCSFAEVLQTNPELFLPRRKRLQNN